MLTPVNYSSEQNKAFIDKWSQHYYKFTNISDAVYYYCVKEIRNSKINSFIVDIIGAWKEGCLGLNDYQTDLNFSCPQCNTTYYFNNRWTEKCPIAYNGWKYISNNIDEIINGIESNPERLFNYLSTKKFIGYNNKNEEIQKVFGPIFTSTLFNFIFPTQYAILDQFAFKGLQNRFQNIFDNDYSKYNFSQYQKYNKYFFSLNYSDKRNPNITREIDKALFSYGHYLKDNKSINKIERNICNENCKI